MRQHGENARRVADFLAEHPAVEQVFYPGLPGNAYHAIARRNFASGGTVASETDSHAREAALDRAGFGGMVSFLAKGGEAAARRIVSRTQLFTLAESLGGVESLIEHPGAMTHASLAGSPIEVPASLVRLSVGIENADDLLTDLAQAFRIEESC